MSATLADVWRRVMVVLAWVKLTVLAVGGFLWLFERSFELHPWLTRTILTGCLLLYATPYLAARRRGNRAADDLGDRVRGAWINPTRRRP